MSPAEKSGPKVFCSHRSTDKPRVLEVAERLSEAGIDPWVDAWEILPGADFVDAINKGLAECDVGLIFLSSDSPDGKWQQAEISSLTYNAIQEGKPLIPVLLDPEVPVPELLKPRSKLGIEQIEELIDAIYGRTGKPRPQPARAEVRQRAFRIRIDPVGEGRIRLGADLDGEGVAAAEEIQLGARFHYSYLEFLRSDPPLSRQSQAEQADQRDRRLAELGRALGEALFPPAVDEGLRRLLDEAVRDNQRVELAFESEDARLLEIPFEAARLSDGRAPVLEPAVEVLRRLPGPDEEPEVPPGPLKILVAVGAPDEGKTQSAVLDMEAELQAILDALEQARQYGAARVRILEVASPEEIGKALGQQHYHVLHLSGHGMAGKLELEDEDGNPVQVSAADLGRAIRESGRPAPLVFLACCHSGRGESETVSLAQGLLEQGVRQVLAMQASVSDRYATRLAGAFYERLCRQESPRASDALAWARRQVERERLKELQREGSRMAMAAEYATPSLFLRGAGGPLLDRSLELEAWEEPFAAPAVSTVPMLAVGQLVNRRVELRRLTRILLDDPRSVEEIGQKAGVQLCGIGGVGKSALAGRLISRLAEVGRWPVVLGGGFSLGELCGALSLDLAEGSDATVAKIAQQLQGQVSDEVRLRLVSRLLTHYPLLLVLDNFEDNLHTAGGYRDETLLPILQALFQSCQKGKLLMTSRYPLPGAEDWLALAELGPLSAAQTRKLFLRLPRLAAQEPESLQLVQRVIGGHPRMLEYLDGILNRGRARLPAVAQRLRQQAEEQGIDLSLEGRELDQAVREALQVGAGDILLDELLEVVGREEGDLEVLDQAAVFPMPVPLEGLSLALAGVVEADGESPAALQVSAELRQAVGRLASSSLLTRLGEGHVWVHRWTSEALRAWRLEAAYRESCRRGGEYLTWRVRHQSPSVHDLVEATRLFLSAQHFDRAAQEGLAILNFLDDYGRAGDVASLAAEIADSLPEEHPRRPAMLGTEAGALASLGLTVPALDKLQQSAEGLETLVESYPSESNYLRNLSVSYNKLGDLMRALGQGEEAQSHFQSSLEIAERLAAQEPGRADYQRDLSVSYERMGDQSSVQGKGEDALSYYRKALEAAERSSSNDPKRTDYSHQQSVCFYKLGDLMRALGQGEEAQSHYQNSLEIAERLAAQESGRADYERALSDSYERMGGLLHALGQGEEAQSHYQNSLEIRERLAAQEPGRGDYQRDLSVCYERMGDLLQALGQGEEAQSHLQNSLEIAERLASQEPGRGDYQRDLSVCYGRLGDLMRALGQGEQAQSHYQNSLEIAERLASQEPERADYQIDLVASLVRTGQRNHAERALAILKQLDSEGRLSPSHADWIEILEEHLQGMD